MAVDKNIISNRIDHLFRNEYGKLVSVLTKTFGTSNIQLAEDVVQDAMLEALNKWTYNGVPDNPIGWIYKVAKYKVINAIQKDSYKRQAKSQLTNYLQLEDISETSLDHIFSEQEIENDQLRMIFTCCHSSVSSDSQVALTLKTLCGFSIPEIARAFLTTNENINKRLVRARKTIKNAKIPFEVPTGKDLEKRLSSVLETIYLLFNEGYYSSSGDSLIRFELCEEAIGLAEMLASSSSIKSLNTYALLSLMTLNAARFDSRIDEFDNLLDLQNQERHRWNKELITKGLYYLEFATQKNEVSIYHILAIISAHHCTAKDYESTDWESILTLYDLLIDIDNSPIVMLNKAVVLSKTNNAQMALEYLSSIENDSTLDSYLPFYIVKANLNFQNQETEKAIDILNMSLKLPLDTKRKSFINNKILEYRGST